MELRRGLHGRSARGAPGSVEAVVVARDLDAEQLLDGLGHGQAAPDHRELPGAEVPVRAVYQRQGLSRARRTRSVPPTLRLVR